MHSAIQFFANIWNAQALAQDVADVNGIATRLSGQVNDQASEIMRLTVENYDLKRAQNQRGEGGRFVKKQS